MHLCTNVAYNSPSADPTRCDSANAAAQGIIFANVNPHPTAHAPNHATLRNRHSHSPHPNGLIIFICQPNQGKRDREVAADTPPVQVLVTPTSRSSRTIFPNKAQQSFHIFIILIQ